MWSSSTALATQIQLRSVHRELLFKDSYSTSEVFVVLFLRQKQWNRETWMGALIISSLIQEGGFLSQVHNFSCNMNLIIKFEKHFIFYLSANLPSFYSCHWHKSHSSSSSGSLWFIKHHRAVSHSQAFAWNALSLNTHLASAHTPHYRSSASLVGLSLVKNAFRCASADVLRHRALLSLTCVFLHQPYRLWAAWREDPHRIYVIIFLTQHLTDGRHSVCFLFFLCWGITYQK